MPWLRLIRWNNLLIIFLTQWLLWAFLILPENPAVLTGFNFFLLSLSTVLIAAAGYIINDYFDIKIDGINKPGKVVLDRVIPRKQAIIAHSLLNFIAIGLAGIVAFRAHHFEWLLLQATCTLLLWFYSTDFKRQYVAGNIVVALLTAFTVLALILYEPAMRQQIGQPAFGETSLDYLDVNPAYVLLVYAFFAFMLTWIREIVKDMEDVAGDAANNCRTMPIVIGLSGAIKFTRILGTITAGLLLYCGLMLLVSGNLLLGGYVILLVVTPLAMLLIYLSKKLRPAYFHKLSSRLKLIMLSGLGTILVYHFMEWYRAWTQF